MEQVLTAAALLGLAVSSPPASMQLVLPLSGDAERKVITYHCEGVENPFDVEYINAAPNFLALVPVGGDRLIFASGLAADGTRYSSGPFEWWAHGTDATFADLRQQPAEPVDCSEMNETP